MYIKQKNFDHLGKFADSGKVVVIYGPRRCGKTTLIRKFMEEMKEPALYVTADDIDVREQLESESAAKMKNFIGNNRWLFIDEAQRVRNAGRNIKLLIDSFPDLRIVVTGSSSLDLLKKLGEPLTGRKITLMQYPLSIAELRPAERPETTSALLENRLIYGLYPEAVLAADDGMKQLYLRELIGSALFKDILELDGIRHSAKLSRLLQLLAFQIGKEVSYNELGTSLGLSKNTVDRYLDLLEKSFVLVRLGGFNRNLRSEITKNSRFYFYDNGIRNALINNFNPLSLRDDAGQLWENFIVMEMVKKNAYTMRNANTYFWRTYDQKEIDFIEEKEGKIAAYEMKYSAGRIKPPSKWAGAYPDSEFHVIHRDNYLEYVVY